MCAKLVLSRGKYDSAKQAIKARIKSKILTTMYNCGTGGAPTYLIELSSVNPRQRLRSTSDPGIIYDIPFNKKTRLFDFCTIGPKIWNNLTLYIKQSVSIYVFSKKTLITHYFRQFYDLF